MTAAAFVVWNAMALQISEVVEAYWTYVAMLGMRSEGLKSRRKCAKSFRVLHSKTMISLEENRTQVRFMYSYRKLSRQSRKRGAQLSMMRVLL